MNRTDATDGGYRRETIPGDLSTLSSMSDYDLAEQTMDPRGYELCSRDGEVIGEIIDLVASPSSGQAHLVVVEARGWGNNRQFTVPLETLGVNDLEERAYAPFLRADFEAAPEFGTGDRDYGRYESYWRDRYPNGASMGQGATADVDTPTLPDMTRADTSATVQTDESRDASRGQRSMASGASEIRVPVTEETAEVRRELREIGQVQIRKRAEVETRHISEPVTRTRVVAEVRDVPAGAAHAQDVTPLNEGETLRVPVVEEELEVRKVPRTKEVVIRTEQRVEQVERDVELRRERVDVEEEGDVEVEHTERVR